MGGPWEVCGRPQTLVSAFRRKIILPGVVEMDLRGGVGWGGVGWGGGVGSVGWAGGFVWGGLGGGSGGSGAVWGGLAGVWGVWGGSGGVWGGVWGRLGGFGRGLGKGSEKRQNPAHPPSLRCKAGVAPLSTYRVQNARHTPVSVFSLRLNSECIR